MTHYIYPQNLKAAANMWLWSLRDFAIMGVAALLYGFLTIRMDDTTILDFIRYAGRYFITTQQYYEWR